jgi:hypothetical protein
MIYPINQILITAALLLCCSAGYASAPAVQVGADFRRMSMDDCTSKAIDVMMDKQNFIQAEASDSYAWGYTENSLAIVHSVAINDGVYIFVAVFGTDSTEAERLRNAIREQVFDGPNIARRAPRRGVYRTNDANRRVTSLRFEWAGFSKPATPDFFRSCAQSAMQRNGLQYSASGKQTIFGIGDNVAVVALAVSFPSHMQILVVAVSQDANEAARLTNEVRSSISGCSSL